MTELVSNVSLTLSGSSAENQQKEGGFEAPLPAAEGSGYSLPSVSGLSIAGAATVPRNILELITPTEEKPFEDDPFALNMISEEATSQEGAYFVPSTKKSRPKLRRGSIQSLQSFSSDYSGIQSPAVPSGGGSVKEPSIAGSGREISISIPAEFIDAILLSNAREQDRKCIFDYQGEEELSSLSSDLITKLNMIYMTEHQAFIPETFLDEYLQSCYGPKNKKWYSYIFHHRKAKQFLDGDLQHICKHASVPIEGKPSYFLVPTVLAACAEEMRKKLSTTGVFRISGNSKRITALLEKFNCPPDYGAGFSFAGYNPFDCADVIKQFFKNLTPPLFPELLFPLIMSAAKIDDQFERVRASQLIVMLLPRENILVLSYLIDLLNEVSLLHNENQMTDVNLATIFASSLIRSPNPEDAIKGAVHSIKFLGTMIKNSTLFQFERLNTYNILNPPTTNDSRRRTRRKSVLKVSSSSKDGLDNVSVSEQSTTSRRKSVVINMMLNEVQVVPARGSGDLDPPEDEPEPAKASNELPPIKFF